MITATLLPADIRNGLEKRGLDRREILFSIDTAISLDGSLDRQWLVVTPDHVSVVRDTNRSEVVESIAWNEVLAFRTVAGVGSGLLQGKLRLDDEDEDSFAWVDILRFTNAMATRFHKVSRRVGRMLEERASPPLSIEGHREATPPASICREPIENRFDPPRCSNCQLRLANEHVKCPRCLQKGQILKRVAEIIRPYRRGAMFLSLLTVVGVVAELIPPKLQQYLVDGILNPKAGVDRPADFTTALLVVVLALAFSRIMLSLVGVIKGRLATRIGTGLTSTLRSQMVKKLQQLAVVYYDRHQVGSTLSRVAHDSEVLHGMMHQITGGFLLQTVQLLGVGAMLLWLNPKLAMFTLIPVPLVFLGSWIFWRKVYPRYYRLWDASSKQMSVLNGMLSGIRVVKAFAQEDREYERFRSSSDHLRQWRLWVDHTNASYSAAMQLVFSLGGLIVWYVGGRDVIGGDMTLGQLIAFLAYLAMFYAPLTALSNFTTWLTSFLSGSKRVLELLDMPLTIAEAEEPAEWRDPKGAIRFNDVSFGYDSNQPVLQDVSFDVAPGEMIGIVGRSGSGKTTMVNLLSRFYDVQEGSITIDGIDIRDLSTKQLRQNVGIVFQESFLFRGTIWNNLSYGRPETTVEEGLSAAIAAGAHDFICRSQLGYETLLGERGAGVSGGEKQRLSIARTLLYDPKILILDEATSNIDAESERSIQQALEVLTKERTTVAIAHRLSTLRNADRILVFDRGRLVEQGSHAELLNQDGVYARLVRIQTQVSKSHHVDRLLVRDEQSDEPPIPNNIVVRNDTGLSKKSAIKPPSRKKSDLKLSSSEESAESELPPRTLRWLDSNNHTFCLGRFGQLELIRDQQRIGTGLFLLRTFPASYPSQYLSVRGYNSEGDEIEYGLIRDLDDWSQDEQRLLRNALERRYLMREITKIHNINLKAGFLDFDVETPQGRQQFAMRWTQSQATEFSENGKLLIDSEENRYLLRDLSVLPTSQAETFQQYVYW